MKNIGFPKEIFGFSMKIQIFLRKYKAFHEKHSFSLGSIWILKENPNFPKELLLSERGKRILFNFLMKSIEKVRGNEEEASRENSGDFRIRNSLKIN